MKFPGGKGGAYQKLINLMPPHDVYIETHLGGGAVIRNKRPARSNLGIEIDSEVVEMWTSMHSTPIFTVAKTVIILPYIFHADLPMSCFTIISIYR